MTAIGDVAQTGAATGLTGALPSQPLDKEAFMGLLVAQLQNQDPLDPASNQELSAQLAQFSSLEQLENLNENLMTMVLLQQSNALLSQLTEGSALIGHSVTWLDPTTGEGGTGVVSSVKVTDGVAFLKIGDDDVALIDVTEVHGLPDEPADETGTDEGGGEESQDEE